jgi:hypothetical protein
MQLQNYRFAFRGAAYLLSSLVVGFPITGRSAVPDTNHSPSVLVTPASPLPFPGGQFDHSYYHGPDAAKILADCNSPLEWRGDTLYVFNSWDQVWRGEGPDALHLRRGTEVQMDPALKDLRLWMESTHRDEKGVLYGWVHNEYPNVCPNRTRTMPSGHPLLARIAALRSTDNGKSWKSLGWVMPGRPDELKCDTEGTYYVGGFGDFSTFVDKEKQYIYIFFASYARDFAEQGLAVARMRYADRSQPVGKLAIWDGGKWTPWPDEHGHIAPFVPAAADIHTKNGKIFWGPSIHWNTYLNKYVMVVNQTKNAAWDTDGQYVLFSDTLSDPRAWSKPVKFMDWEQTHQSQPTVYGHGWYVQIVGIGKGETDKLASQTARLFLDGQSSWQIRFRKPGEE